MYVPVQLCAYALKYKHVNEFKLYLFLKYTSKHGHCQIGKKRRFEIAKQLNMKSESTVRSLLNRLLALYWITRDIDRLYFIIGYKQLFDSTERQDDIIFHKTRVEFSFKYFKNFRAYLAGAVFGFFINLKRAEIMKEGRKKTRSIKPFPELYPLSLCALNRLLNINISTLQNYRTLAIKNGFIYGENRFINKSYIPIEAVNNLKKAYPDHANRIQIKDNEIVYRLPNCFKPLLKYKQGSGFL